MTHTRSISDVQDILYDVFPHLDTEQYVSPEELARVRRTLIRSAMTCKTFTRPALSILWRCLPSDRPLLSLLSIYGIVQQQTSVVPGSSAEAISNPHHEQLYTLCTSQDPRTHPQWGRFQDYAAWVRKVTLNSFDGSAWSVWNEMAPLMVGQPILPVLCGMSLHGYSFHARKAGVLQLIAPSIREISFSFFEAENAVAEEDVEEFQALFQDACEAAPLLEQVEIRIPDWPLNLGVLHANERLHAISIDKSPIDMELLEPLSQLPHLETLSVAISETIPTSTFALKSLLNLTLKGGFQSMTAYFNNIDLPHLQSLTLSAVQFDPAQLIHDAARCFQTLATQNEHITALSVECHKISAGAHALMHGRTRSLVSESIPTGGTFISMVSPLLSLSALRDIGLRFPIFVFAYTSADIRALAEAWPALEALHIDFSTLDRPGLRAGFESVVHFARFCPRLRVLRLPTMELARGAVEEEVARYLYPKAETENPDAHGLRELEVAEVVFPKNADLSGEVTEFVQRIFACAATPFTVEHPIVVIDEESGDRSRFV